MLMLNVSIPVKGELKYKERKIVQLHQLITVKEICPLISRKDAKEQVATELPTSFRKNLKPKLASRIYIRVRQNDSSR
uniref:Putative ovule protein n=1 Tax=Solanum chacoense TaxID=4108 RepID=A0A0V0HI63_SOLCH